MYLYTLQDNESSIKKDIKTGLEVAVKNWGFSGTSGHGSTQTSITTKQNRTLSVTYMVNVSGSSSHDAS